MQFKQYRTKIDLENAIKEFLQQHPNLVCLMFNYSGSVDFSEELSEILKTITTNAPQILGIKIDIDFPGSVAT